MKLYFYKHPVGNFGDELNPWLWSRLLPDFLDDDERSIFIGIGTLLNDRVPLEPFKVVFSTGVGYLGPPPPVNGRWKIYCVRGPLSAQKLGLNRCLAITDGAALVRTVDIPKEEKIHNFSFVPHIRSQQANWRRVCRSVGINYIDPAQSVEIVLRDIQRSKVIIAEAMHAAIVADALRIPWIPVKFHSHILEFKWQDWCQSVDLDYKPVTLLPILQRRYHFPLARRLKYGLTALTLKWITWQATPLMSSDTVIESVTTKLQEKLELLKQDYLH